MKLKKIIKYLNSLDTVQIWQGDTMLALGKGDPDNWEMVYEGSVMDIPWYLLDFYLTNTTDAEAIGSGNYTPEEEKKGSYLCILLCEDKEVAKKYEKGEL